MYGLMEYRAHVSRPCWSILDALKSLAGYSEKKTTTTSIQGVPQIDVMSCVKAKVSIDVKALAKNVQFDLHKWCTFCFLFNLFQFTLKVNVPSFYTISVFFISVESL